MSKSIKNEETKTKNFDDERKYTKQVHRKNEQEKKKKGVMGSSDLD